MPEARGTIRKVASERIEILYEAAVGAAPKDRELAKEYIMLLEEIGRHYKVKIPKGIALHVCKSCCLPLVEGENAELRILAGQKRMICRCKGCGRTNSAGFKKAQPKNR